jgi:hypothetical protein
MNDQALIIRDDSKRVAIFTEVALTIKANALESSALIGAVRNSGEQESAVAAQKDLRRILKDAEDARKAAKEPILEFGKAIDKAAASFVAELKDEEIRIATLVGDFQQAEIKRIQAAEAAARLEAERVENERRAELMRIARAEAMEKARLDAEAKAAAEAAAKATSEAERARAAALQADIDRQRALSESKTMEAMDAANTAADQAAKDIPKVESNRVEGQSVRQPWEITVTNIWDLARAHPFCVKIEARLKEIETLLDAGTKVAGVTAKRVVKSTVRLGPKREAINV